MPNDPFYANLYGEDVRVTDVDKDKGTAAVENDGEQQLTTLESLTPPAEMIDPGTQFQFGNETVEVEETDEETGVVGFRGPDGDFDMTTTDSLSLRDLF